MPRRFKVNTTTVQRAASSPAKRETHRLKRSHDDICIGALIFAENGVNLHLDSKGNSLLGISKKHRLTPEHTRKVRVDETRNRVVYIPKLVSFIALYEKIILRKAKKIDMEEHELFGFAREVVYAMQWTAIQQDVLRIEEDKAKRR